MRFRLVFIGQTKSPYLAAGLDDFIKRINPYVPVETRALKGAKIREDRSAEVRLQDTQRLLAAIKPTEVFVHLDPEGLEMTSGEFAFWLKDRMEEGVKSIVFGLGGPLGLDRTAAQRADLRLCLSRMTLTHEMSRLVLAEQIYRAMRVNTGHPYHK
jgi:23S rRNA (pseudouridine1915-N3)-methyltransferase